MVPQACDIGGVATPYQSSTGVETQRGEDLLAPPAEGDFDRTSHACFGNIRYLKCSLGVGVISEKVLNSTQESVGTSHLFQVFTKAADCSLADISNQVVNTSLCIGAQGIYAVD